MAELSPATQAVLDAYGTCNSTYEAQVNTLNTGGQRLAAAFTAAALWVDWESGDPKFLVLAIAAELEQQ